jgi:hypothetical protein
MMGAAVGPTVGADFVGAGGAIGAGVAAGAQALSMIVINSNTDSNLRDMVLSP